MAAATKSSHGHGRHRWHKPALLLLIPWGSRWSLGGSDGDREGFPEGTGSYTWGRDTGLEQHCGLGTICPEVQGREHRALTQEKILQCGQGAAIGRKMRLRRRDPEPAVRLRTFCTECECKVSLPRWRSYVKPIATG